jgi:hypothetical protein
LAPGRNATAEITQTKNPCYRSAPIPQRNRGVGSRNEPIKIDGPRASRILQRRINQSVAECEVSNTLESGWGGLRTHVRDGWNIGKPPYGYGPRATGIPTRPDFYTERVFGRGRIALLTAELATYDDRAARERAAERGRHPTGPDPTASPCLRPYRTCVSRSAKRRKRCSDASTRPPSSPSTSTTKDKRHR